MGKAVVGEGSPDAEILFVGEAPGRKEAESGRPFVGKAGQWLRRAIRRIGLDEDAVYISGSSRCSPECSPHPQKWDLRNPGHDWDAMRSRAFGPQFSITSSIDRL